jgi:glc operon protein GlcG
MHPADPSHLETAPAIGSILPMLKLLVMMLTMAAVTFAAELPTKKYLNLAAVKTMVAGAEAEAAKQGVEVTICIVDEGGTFLFLQKADGVSVNTLDFCRDKARYAALYGNPSREAAEAMKNGDARPLAFPSFFPNQGGLPIKVDGKTLGGIAASGAKSEIDEAIAQAGLDALFKK